MLCEICENAEAEWVEDLADVPLCETCCDDLIDEGDIEWKNVIYVGQPDNGCPNLSTQSVCSECA
jgi:hypothetical protein